VRGDLGESIRTRQSVAGNRRAPSCHITLELACLSLLIAIGHRHPGRG
jgi:hypothetical protein